MATRPITLHTVPHTGTHFVTKIFTDVFGLTQKTDWNRVHATWVAPSQLRPPELVMIQTAMEAEKLIVTARDPYLSAIRWIGKKNQYRGGRPLNRGVDEMYNSWNHFFDVLSKKEYFIVDIGCREKDRVQHISNLVDFLDIEVDIGLVKDFASTWKPEYTSDSNEKQTYLNSSVLPVANKGSWDMLDDAVKWYASLDTNDYDLP